MAKQKDGSNTFDPQQIANYVRKIEGHFDELASEQGSYMARCRNIRQSIGVVYTEASALGIPKKVLKAQVELRKLERRKEGIVAALEGDDADTFEVIADALGEFAALPLGMAALSAARKDRANETAADDAAMLDDLTDDELAGEPLH